MSKIPYVKFMKHAQKVVKSPTCKSRPILGGVLHRDNYVAVTDTHRLYFASDMYEGDEKVECPRTGAQIDGNYPDVLRLIPDSDAAMYTASLDVVTTEKAVKLIENAGKIDKSTDMIVFEINDEGLAMFTGEGAAVACKYEASNTYSREPRTMYASAKYVAEALALCKDAGLTQVQFNFYGEARPFTFTGGNLTALILPIRRA
ncbi:hypothetical protein [Sporosarcina sp. ITBMC105]